MALNCAGTKFVGKDVLFEFALACGDVDPATLSWMPLGAARNKSVTMSSDTVDATADDSVGGIRETLTTYKTFEVSVDGVTKRDDGTTANQGVLFDHYITDPQPYLWIRLTGPIKTVIAFCVLTEFSEEYPYDDVATYSISASATASDAGIIVEPTPIPVSSVVVLPATVSVAVAATTQLTATVNPSIASQAVTWVSATPGTATVSSTGLVTGVAAGVVVITATSVADPTKSDSSTVTVTV